MGTLYIVGTPIGNLEDITLRALRTLKEVDVILCEDTRVTKKLLQRYEIDKPVTSFHANSGFAKLDYILELLNDDKNLALVADAGTPGISDPGTLLVAKVREAGATVIGIPGPSALATAVSIAGVPTNEFIFMGFLPHKKGRQTIFKEIGAQDRTVILYESPHRFMKTLESLKEFAGEKLIAVAREMTKIHEEVVRGTAEELIEHFTAHPDTVRGEFVIIVSILSTVALDNHEGVY